MWTLNQPVWAETHEHRQGEARASWSLQCKLRVGPRSLLALGRDHGQVQAWDFTCHLNLLRNHSPGRSEAELLWRNWHDGGKGEKVMEGNSGLSGTWPVADCVGSCLPPSYKISTVNPIFTSKNLRFLEGDIHPSSLVLRVDMTWLILSQERTYSTNSQRNLCIIWLLSLDFPWIIRLPWDVEGRNGDLCLPSLAKM